MKRRFNIVNILFKSVLGVINLIIIFLFIMSAYSDRISPIKSTLMAYLGLAYPFFAVLTILFVIYWLCIREWRFLIIGICVLFVCKDSLLNYFPIHTKNKDVPTEQTIKILTYNVMGFGYKDHSRREPNPIIDYIIKSDADIIFLQEYATGNSKTFLTQQKINNAFKMYRYRSVIPLGSSGNLKYAIAVYSKYPISKSRRIPYKSTFNGSSVHEIEVDGKKLTVINNHLESFKLTMEDRANYSSFMKNMNSDTFDGLRNSIEHKLGPAFRIRASQADVVAEEIKSIKTDYILVCGDFNDTPISYVHHTIKGPLSDAFATSGCGLGITYNQNNFWFRIDNILYSSNMKAYNCTVDKVKYSDHYPMWCYLRLKD